MIRMQFLAFLAALCAANPVHAEPMELRGRIDAHMAEKVRSALAAGVRDFTINSSDGGFVIVAVSMAHLMRDHDASLTINGRCASACALLAIGMINKRYTSEAAIEIHGARYMFKPPGGDDDGPARAAAAYMVGNGVPTEIAYGPGMGINSHRLSNAELDRMGFQPGR